jgi:hypothetical protein
MINTIELGPRDILVVTVPIADMSLARSNTFLHEMKGMIRDIVGPDQPLLIMPSKSQDTSMSVLKR